MRPRLGTHAVGVLDPAVVEPLAALLDGLASGAECNEPGIGPEIDRAAVAVARVVLRSCPPSVAGGLGQPEL